MKLLQVCLIAAVVACAMAAPPTPPTPSLPPADEASNVANANSTLISRAADYAHGTCSFHALIIQNCCVHGNLLANPSHCGYVDIAAIKDGRGNDITGLGGDMGKRIQLHRPGSQEIGPTKTITGMEEVMEYKWYEWSGREKMTYRYGNCYWDEGAWGEPGTYSGDCLDPKPYCNRGAWTADGVCAIAMNPYRRFHDMDCFFPC